MKFPQIIIQAIIIAAIIAILLVALHYFGIAIPGFVVTIFWILVCATVAIFAVRWLYSLWTGGPPAA
jgi:hypothetical protein